MPRGRRLVLGTCLIRGSKMAVEAMLAVQILPVNQSVKDHPIAGTGHDLRPMVRR